MTKIINLLKRYTDGKQNTEKVEISVLQLNRIIKALEQQPCDDAISRQEVLEQTYQWSKDEFLRVANPFCYLSKKINSLSPVNPHPQPKTGHWININETHSKCDRCGAVFEIASENGEANYCPNCGSKMYEDKGVLEQLAEKQNNLLATTKAWSDVIEKNGYVI